MLHSYQCFIFLEEIQNQLKDCQPKFVIIDCEQVEKFLEISKNVLSIQVF